MPMSEADIESFRALVMKPNSKYSREELMHLIETALAAHRYRAILKHGVMVQNINDKGLGHTNHCQQLETDFWKDAREAVKNPSQLGATDALVESLHAEPDGENR